MSTSVELHRFDRVRQRPVKDLLHHHRSYVEEWNRFEVNCVRIFRMHRESAFREYLGWYQSATWKKLRQRWTDEDYVEIGSSDDEDTPYDNRTRGGSHVELGPVLDRVGVDVKRSVNEIGNVLVVSVGEPGSEGVLRNALEKMQRRLRRIAARCGCRERVLEDVARAPSPPPGPSSSGAGPSWGAGHDDAPDLGLDTTTDVISQLEDAPVAMQPSQPRTYYVGNVFLSSYG